ncbi:hypothetical protein [Speluncibacter jeojiensis]|uniref:Uncharacterized protein n=1 Tax=Speluncibacter jeojiensis TaxID=2710754 RepID=A0A9X4LZJ4_9ACTN|nr:hypothetical protein [Corynebacteriales bacterium D3-21]
MLIAVVAVVSVVVITAASLVSKDHGLNFESRELMYTRRRR